MSFDVEKLAEEIMVITVVVAAVCLLGAASVIALGIGATMMWHEE